MSEGGLSEKRIKEIRAYIWRFQDLCDRHLGRIANPKGMRVLVIGSGYGTEVLWALRHGAREVVGVDPGRRDDAPLRTAVAEKKLKGSFEILQTTTIDLPPSGDFDLVVSNNVFEHVFALKATLRSLRGLLAPRGRVAVFTNPLFYSSLGAHLHPRFERWEHLHLSDQELRAETSEWLFGEFKHGLNEMTVTDFLGAVREAGLVLLDFRTIPDRNIKHAAEVLPKIRERTMPMDACLEGIVALMCFPEGV